MITLYNGIELPDQWPPKRDGMTRQPMPVPYLEHRPAVAAIDVGRQLFVDDFLVEETTLTRTFHSAEFHPANPVLQADQPWEITGDSNVAHPYSGGVWHDPSDGLFKMWYVVGNEGWITHRYGYATSSDGVVWEKPSLEDIRGRRDELAGTNVILDITQHDSSTIWLDHDAADTAARFKYFATEHHDDGWHYTYRTSGDGIHWSESIVDTPMHGDRTTVFHNPFRDVWCLSQRIHPAEIGRARAYMEHADPRQLVEKASRNEHLVPDGGAVFWTGADELDPRNPAPEYSGIEPELYNLDAAPYESLMLGFFTIWSGPENGVVSQEGLQKRCEIFLGFSRDGFHWDRPSRERFIPVSWDKKAWNFGNTQSTGGGCLIVGDRLHFYFSGKAVDPTGLHGQGSTGLATLRRDGFASMDAGSAGGTLTTRPLTFDGKCLYVNVDCPDGELRADVLDEAGVPIEPFTLSNCRAVSCDSTRAAIAWHDDLSSLAGKAVRFRFHLTNGNLYAFWVSADESGASHGYVAAGGPGLTGPTDTVGQGDS